MEQETFYQEDNMNKLTIAKDLTTNAPVVLDLPSITLAVGDKLSGKTFLIRKLIEKKEDGRILLLTNKADSYHGLGEVMVKLDAGSPAMNFQDRLTIIDASDLYDDDPNHSLDVELAHLRDQVQADDMIIVDEAYPFMADELNKYELMKTAEIVRGKGASMVITTNQPLMLIEKAPVLFKISNYMFCLRQSKQTATKICEIFAGEQGKYELLRSYDVFDFGKGIFASSEGDLGFVQVQ